MTNQMDKELIKKYRLSEAVKRFGMINEYIYETFDEADDPNADADPMAGGDPNAQADPAAAMGGAPDAEMDPNAMGGAPDAQADPMAGGDPNTGMDPASMGGDPNAMGGAPVDMDGEGMPGDNMDDPNGETDPAAMGDDNGMTTEPMQDGDEVIDVDDLTNAQEETDYKIDGVDEKLTQLMQVVDKFEAALASQDEKVAELKKELEMRNPTPTERLNLRSQAGYPYNEQPKDFWEKKTAEAPQYEIDFGNEDNTKSADREEYILRKGDAKGGNDRDIADSFKSYKLSDFINY